MEEWKFLKTVFATRDIANSSSVQGENVHDARYTLDMINNLVSEVFILPLVAPLLSVVPMVFLVAAPLL